MSGAQKKEDDHMFVDEEFAIFVPAVRVEPIRREYKSWRQIKFSEPQRIDFKEENARLELL